MLLPGSVASYTKASLNMVGHHEAQEFSLFYYAIGPAKVWVDVD